MNNLKYHQFNSNKVLEFLKNDRLEIDNPSSYFPLLQKYTKKKINPTDNFQWFHRYKLIHVKNSNKETDHTEVSHRIFKGAILDTHTKQKIYKGIFFKLSHILNPALLITNYYGENNNKWTIDRIQTAKNLVNKMYDYNNSAYIESFAYFLTSRLVEKNMSPHFPLLFGIYSGNAKRMLSDYTEEYLDSKDDKWFKNGIQNKKWNIIKKNFTEKYTISNQSNKQNTHEESSQSSIDDNTSNESDTIDSIEEESMVSISDKSEIEESQSNEMNDLNLDDLSEINIDKTDNEITHQTILETYNVPVQIIALECFDKMMEEEQCEDIDKLEEYYYLSRNDLENYPEPKEDIKDDEEYAKIYGYNNLYIKKLKEFDNKWFALTTQICMALLSMQKNYQMIHNDLHNQNIMLKTTKKEYLFYKVNNTLYKVPTYGYIIKIIDFGRATFKFKNKEIMGDVFAKDEDAGEQYTYINSPIKKGEEIIKPNPSFDLCRLACSIMEDGEYDENDSLFNDSEYYKLMIKWTLDKDGQYVTQYQGFSLYKMISTDVKDLAPEDVIKTYPFNTFISNEEPINKKWIYKIC